MEELVLMIVIAYILASRAAVTKEKPLVKSISVHSPGPESLPAPWMGEQHRGWVTFVRAWK